MTRQNRRQPASEAAQQAMRQSSHRLHHLSMRYVGARKEMLSGEKIAFLPADYPGLHEMRDLFDLVLLTRAEINALTALLVDAGVFNLERFTREVTEQYEWLAREKARHFGCTVTDQGLQFDLGHLMDGPGGPNTAGRKGPPP